MRRSHAVATATDETLLAQYIRTANSQPRLEREEEVSLAADIRKGDAKALERMVLGNLFLTIKIARNYVRSGIALADLINEGNIGLIRACRRYDPAFGLRFASYANWWIKQRISMYLIQHGRGAITVPIRKVVMFKAIAKETQILQNKLHRAPTVTELATRMKVSPDTVKETIGFIPEYVAMDEVLAGQVSGTHDGMGQVQTSGQISEVEARLEHSTLRKDLDDVFSGLSAREKDGVLLFYGLAEGEPMTFADLGRRLNISREGARQLIKRSLDKMRAHRRVATLKEYL